jgi:hypothetical protein
LPSLPFTWSLAPGASHTHSRSQALHRLQAADGTDKASSSSQGTPGASAQVEPPKKLTTWEYGKTRADPTLGPMYVAFAFIVPFLLIVAPFLPLPKF